jgi:GxxExxY protein
VREEFSALSYTVLGCAIKVHRHLGPGLFESVYKQCLAVEMEIKGIPFDFEVKIPVTYEGRTFREAYRADFLVDGSLVIELKSVQKLLPVHTSQVVTYMRLLNAAEGLLLNFWVPRLKDDGIRRLVTSRENWPH